GGAGAVLKLLRGDFHRLCWSSPMPFPGRREVIEDDGRTQLIGHGWGGTVRSWKSKSGTPEHIGFECQNRKIWEEKFKPALLSTGIQVSVGEAARAHRDGRTESKWCYLAGLEIFEITRRLMGDEIALIAMVEDPEWVRDVSQTCTDMVLQDYEAIFDAGIHPDGLWIYGDMAYRHSTMCSPDMYRDLIWPDHRRQADWAHQRGMKVIFHTDGDVNGVIDLYLDAGFDCLQPLEAKASMDVRKLCPSYGDRLSHFGNIDVMIMMTNDREQIEEEIRTKFAAGMATKGYAYHSDHSVPPQVSWETYQFILELLEKYGWYE
ncbi:MAG: uroporphyrinogen decarboxylase family protein, partial [Planctomycetota bacterium]|nr:uroporphyrinogen decarboxylase family protein [Planctomycetota bacterium]